MQHLKSHSWSTCIAWKLSPTGTPDVRCHVTSQCYLCLGVGQNPCNLLINSLNLRWKWKLSAKYPPSSLSVHWSLEVLCIPEMLGFHTSRLVEGLPWCLTSKESTCNVDWPWIPEFNPLVRKIPRRRKWQPTPVFLPGKNHGQMSLAGYSPWGRKESDMTECTYTGWLRPRDTADTVSLWYRLILHSAHGILGQLCLGTHDFVDLHHLDQYGVVLARQLCHRRASTTWRCPTNSQGLFCKREHLVIWLLIQEAPWLLTAAHYTNNTPLKVFLCMPSVHQTHPSRGPDSRTHHTNVEGVPTSLRYRHPSIHLHDFCWESPTVMGILWPTW